MLGTDAELTVAAGVLWLFMFNSPMGVVSHALRAWGVPWDHLLNAEHAMALVVLAVMRFMQIRWTRTWAEKGGRARLRPAH